MKRLPILFAAALAAGCSNSGPVGNGASDGGNVAAAVVAANNAAEAATANSVAPTDSTPAPASSQATTAAAGIPAGLQGRWGMAPADCTSTLGDAKGLLIINSDELRFYESRARPSANLKAGPASLSGDFAFSGEGQQWTRFESLEVREGKLVRTESSPMASYTYARCT